MYDSVPSIYNIVVRLWDYKGNTSLNSFNHSPDFELNKWVYIGVSVFKTNRFENSYDIHIVSKTYSGIENQDSYLSQDIILKCFNAEYSKNFNKYVHSNYMYGIGSLIMNETMKFTGIYYFKVSFRTNEHADNL